MNKTFGERLEEILEDKRIKRKDLAKKIDVTDQSVGYYVNDKVIPSAKKLIEIAETLNVSIDYLCGLSDIKEIKDTHIENIINNEEYYNLTKEIINNEENYKLVKKLLENRNNFKILSVLVDLNDQVKENVLQMLESLKN